MSPRTSGGKAHSALFSRLSQWTDYHTEPERPDSRASSLRTHPPPHLASGFSLCKMGLMMPAPAASSGSCSRDSGRSSPNCVTSGSSHFLSLDLSFHIFKMGTNRAPSSQSSTHARQVIPTKRSTMKMCAELSGSVSYDCIDEGVPRGWA